MADIAPTAPTPRPIATSVMPSRTVRRSTPFGCAPSARRTAISRRRCDTETANTFYGDLFHDALFGPDARPDFGRAAVSDVFPAEMPPHFLVHFAVEECETALRTVNRLGGRVQAPPFETSYGKVAVVTDNQGASFAVLERVRWAVEQ